MITKDTAVSLSWRDTPYHVSAKNTDGSPVRARVNGQTKVWKRVSPEHPEGDFQLPVKYGMFRCFSITPANAAEWELPK